ncbi:MAG: 4Fe-4S dicluster domain-containing protein [Thermofilum sp.]
MSSVGTTVNPRDRSRREFLRTAAITCAVGATVLMPLTKVLAEAKTEPLNESRYLPSLPAQKENEGVLLRMQRELQESLQKPITERRWVMVIDLRKCVACHACTVACIAENRSPPGVTYRPVLEWETGEYPNVSRAFLPRPCFHCDNPPCVPVCPVKATWKREDGVVVIDYSKCIGCRYCVAACPYGARATDFGFDWDSTPAGPATNAPLMNKEAKSLVDDLPSMEYVSTPWYGRWRRADLVGVTRKCHFCTQRIDNGMLPQCVTTCMGVANYFGDIKNPKSLVSELLKENRAIRLKEELGTEPSVYYIVGPGSGGTDIDVKDIDAALDDFVKVLLQRELKVPLGVSLK